MTVCALENLKLKRVPFVLLVGCSPKIDGSLPGDAETGPSMSDEARQLDACAEEVFGTGAE
jgi:hypothetical protein